MSNVLSLAAVLFLAAVLSLEAPWGRPPINTYAWTKVQRLPMADAAVLNDGDCSCGWTCSSHERYRAIKEFAGALAILEGTGKK